MFAALVLALSSCTKLFFYPQQKFVATPDQFGYSYENIWLTTRDEVRIHAWLLKPDSATKGTIFFLHGNAENISTHTASVAWLVDRGYEVLALDYRGFGRSDGSPDIPEVFDDIQAGTQWLANKAAKQNDPKPLYLLGQSLGASLAITYVDHYPSSKNVFRGLIVEAAFASYGAIAKHVAAGHWITWLFQYPAQWLITARYDPIKSISNVSPLPLLIVHSVEDEVIPYRNAHQLFAQARQNKSFISTTGYHIQGGTDPRVQQAIIDFFEANP